MHKGQDIGKIFDTYFDIKYYDSEVYSNAIISIVESLSKTKGVITVAQFGNVGFPGISDIDMLVIAEDKYFFDIECVLNDMITVSEEMRYLFTHPISVLPLSIFRECMDMHSFSNIKVLWGNGDLIDQYNVLDSDKYYNFYKKILWDSFFWNALSNILHKRTGLRKLLMLHSNISYSVISGMRLLSENNDIPDLTDKVSSIRADILCDSSNSMIERFLYEFVSVIEKLIEYDWKLDRFWRDISGLPSEKDYIRLKVKPGVCFTFTGDKSFEKDLKFNLVVRRYLLSNDIILPMVYYNVLIMFRESYFPHIEKFAGGMDISFCEKIKECKFLESIENHNSNVLKIRNFFSERGRDEYYLFNFPFWLPFGIYPGSRFSKIRKTIIKKIRSFDV